ncbi:unnamed protein product [Vicia faba]|uniref:Uncharacterized protein n=1 Tax=Vicia faba TaxID=3906 RepID=A0AAV0YQB7_VICFA|nr:unnamed protein product [Vicia faba]
MLNSHFQAQGVSINFLENQVGQIASALTLRTMRALPSSTKTLTSTSQAKSIETCKVIKLRSGKECEGSTSTRKESPKENLITHDTSEKEVYESTKEKLVLEPIVEMIEQDRSTLKTSSLKSSLEKLPIAML